ncbi:MAG: hypothetical protein R6U26_00990 [Candidatus Undinarchaeales archaeon]
MYQIKVRCPHCGRTRNFEPKVKDRSKWTATCFFCGKSFKVFPKSKPSRVAKS